MGALPKLYAATARASRAARTSGPTASASSAAIPKLVSPNRAARNEQTARRLWEVSEELTGVRYRARRAGLTSPTSR